MFTQLSDHRFALQNKYSEIKSCCCLAENESGRGLNKSLMSKIKHNLPRRKRERVRERKKLSRYFLDK